MARTGLELISTADIARLAGQSRATVGNWKARNPDFPPERGRSPRGPLYDRAEVTQWLESTNRLDKRHEEVAAMWQVADQLRGSVTMQDALPLILVLLAVMSSSSPADWQKIRQAPPRDLDAILRSSALSLFPFAEELIPRGRLPAEPLLQVVGVLSELDRPHIPAVADALLEQAAQAMGKMGGEYLSPPSVRRLVVALAEPVGSLYNPASGSGQLLVDAAAAAGPDRIELFGQEINSAVWAMARLNLTIHGVHAEIALGDVFRDDECPQLRAQRVVSVPPWIQRLRILDDLQGDPRWVWGEPGPNDSNAAWIQHCLYHLADGGRAVIVMANRALFEGGRAGRIRQRIIKAGLLDAVLALPPGLFHTTSLATSILVFAKGRPRANGEPAPTLMVNLRGSSEGRTSRSASLGDNVIAEAAHLYHNWTAGEEPASEIAAIAHYDNLADNDFVIDPGRYVAVPPPASDLDEVADERSALLNKLERLSQVSRAADDHLKAILEAHQ